MTIHIDQTQLDKRVASGKLSKNQCDILIAIRLRVYQTIKFDRNGLIKNKLYGLSRRYITEYNALIIRSKLKLIQGQVNPKSNHWLIADTDLSKYRRA